LRLSGERPVQAPPWAGPFVAFALDFGVAQRFTGTIQGFGCRSGLPLRFRVLGGAAVYRCDSWLIFIDGFSR